jgi:hypothetical protein
MNDPGFIEALGRARETWEMEKPMNQTASARQIQSNALACVALSKGTVESFYDGSHSATPKQCLHALCESHERLRAELQGAESLLAETPGQAAVRSMLTACKQAVSVLRMLNDFELVCRELIGAKVGDTDLAVILSNVMRDLDNSAEGVEKSLSPKSPEKSDFQDWMGETFYGRDIDLKMEAVHHAHVFTFDQAIELATHIWQCMENKKPPWFSKFNRDANEAAMVKGQNDGPG